MPDKCDLGDNFEPTTPKTAPKMPQPPLPSTPKVQKTEKKKKTQVFPMFFTLQPWYQNRSQNHFRSSQVESKMAILPLAWLILEPMLAHLGALARHLASLVRHLGAVMASNSKQNAIFEPTSSKTAPKMPSKHPKSAKNSRKPKVFQGFRSPVVGKYKTTTGFSRFPEP